MKKVGSEREEGKKRMGWKRKEEREEEQETR